MRSQKTVNVDNLEKSEVHIKPYYDDGGGIVIYHADCREVLPHLAKVDLVLTDPPYGLEGIAGSYGRHGDTIANDLDCTVRDWLIENFNGPMLVFSSPRLPEPPGDWQHRLVWDKAEGGLNGGPWRYNHELIFVRGDGWRRIEAGSFSILRYRIGNGCADRSDHPHRKPTGLIASLIQHAPDGTILDPFMGSGTTLVAAKSLGRRAIGIEIEEKYCETAVERLRQDVLPFAAPEPQPTTGATTGDLFHHMTDQELTVLGEQDYCKEAALEGM
jgi:DNA modification methylase